MLLPHFSDEENLLELNLWLENHLSTWNDLWLNVWLKNFRPSGFPLGLIEENQFDTQEWD